MRLSINPEIEEIFKGDAQQVKEKLKKANRQVKDLNKALRDKRKELAAELRKGGASPREANQQAREQLRNTDLDAMIHGLPERELRSGRARETARAKAQESAAKANGGFAIDSGHEVKGADGIAVIPSQNTVEILESKNKNALTVFDPRSSTTTQVVDGVKTKVPRRLPGPDETVDVGKMSGNGKSAAASHFEQNPEDLDAILKKEKKGVGEGADGQRRLLENKLSAITENLGATIDRAIAAQRAAIQDRGLSSEARAQAQEALRLLLAVKNGQESTLRIVLDLPKNATVSDSELDLAVKMIERSFSLMQQNAGQSEGKLEIVLRKASDDENDPGEDTILRPAG